MAKAKRKRRRPTAGPPPAPQRKTQEEAQKAAADRDRRQGAPRPPSFQGVLIRAGIVLAFFLVYLLWIAKETPQTAIFIAGVAGALMIPLGMGLDRLRYRFQLRRWEQQRQQAG